MNRNLSAPAASRDAENASRRKIDLSGRASKNLAKKAMWMAILYRMLGPKVTALFAASVPVGVTLGIVEIITASILYAVLVQFDLVPGAGSLPSLPFGLAPIPALLLFTLIAGGLRYTGQLLPSFANHALNARLREALVRNILGGATERSCMSVTDVSYLLSTLIPRSGDFVYALSTSAVGFCLLLLVLAGMLHMSWRLTAIVLAFSMLLGVLLAIMRYAYGKHVESMYSTFGRFNTTFIRDARNAHLLRICGVNEAEAERLLLLSYEHVRSFKNYFLVFAASSNVPTIAAVFLMVGILWLNFNMQFLSIDGLVPLVYLLSRTGGSIGGLAAAAGLLRQNRPYIGELARYVPDLFPDNPASSVGHEAPVELFPLLVSELRFGRGVTLVPSVSLFAGAGDMVLISGPSGRGKTTLLMTLIGFLQPFGGTISWGGMPIQRIDPTRLRKRLGYAGPEPYLIDADIRANLLFGLESERISDSDLDRALTLACAEFVFDLDGGLSHRLREAGEGISAGQKQRLAIARCVLRRPDVLLLDEATANIDENTEEQIMKNLKAAFPNLLVVAVSHRASLRRFATTFLEI